MSFFPEDKAKEDKPLIKSEDNTSTTDCSDAMTCCIISCCCIIPGIGPGIALYMALRWLFKDVDSRAYDPDDYNGGNSDDHPENPKNKP